MTSRYTLYDTGQLEQRFTLDSGLPKGVKPHYNISPTMAASVVVNRDGVRVVEIMKWGLVAKGAKDTNSVFRYKTYNTPSEKILSKHSRETAVRQSRCLVPVNGYYEITKTEGGKRAYYVERKDRALFALAGIYSSWQDPEGTVHGTYSVLTAEASSDVSSVSGRMPLIIHQDDEAEWLDPNVSDTNSLYGMIRSYPKDSLQVHEVGLEVDSKKANKPSLIVPIHAS